MRVNIAGFHTRHCALSAVGLIVECGVGLEEFFAALKSLNEKPESQEGQFYVQVLLSVTEYSNFIDMMKHYKKEHPSNAE